MAGPGRAYLGTDHTMTHFKTANCDSAMADTRSYEQWTEDGSRDAQQRANALWKQMLADYQPPPIDAALDENLLAFIAEPKNVMLDAWY